MKVPLPGGGVVDVDPSALTKQHLRYLEALDGRDGQSIVRMAEAGQDSALELIGRLADGPRAPGLPTANGGRVLRDVAVDKKGSR